VFDLNQIDH